MKTLLLVRHAKSDWGDVHLDDHDRPLNDRGFRDAPAMAERVAGRLAEHLSESELDSLRLISSTALRARTTAEAFAERLGLPIELDRDLYLCSPATLLAQAVNIGADTDTVMLVSHNPGITELAWLLSQGGITHMPTCAVATFRWDTDEWNTGEWNTGERDIEQWSEAATLPQQSWSLDTPRTPAQD